MMVFLCGRGPAIEAILMQMAKPGCHKLAVFTHEDAPIIDLAQRLHIPVTTESVNNLDAWPFKPAVIASIGYLTIIKPETIAAVHGRIFNGHGALLPNHRGRSAVPWAIVDGDQLGGITYHWIDSGVDTGRILLQATCQIDPHETQATLFDKVHRLLVAYWPAALHLAMLDWEGVEQEGAEQYHHAGPPYGGIINPLWGDDKIERFIRAMTYPPLPYARFEGRQIHSIAEYRNAVLDSLMERTRI